MAVPGALIVVFQLFVVYLLLLLLSFAVPRMHPILYTSLFLFTVISVLFTVFVPFGKMLIHLFQRPSMPFAALLVASAGIYYVSEVLAMQMQDAGYHAFAQLFQTVVKLCILSLWFPMIRQLFETIEPLIPW